MNINNPYSNMQNRCPKCHCNRPATPPKWSMVPYPNQNQPYTGVEPLAGSWTTNYIFISPANIIYNLEKKPVYFNFKDPKTVDFYKELREVEAVQATLTQSQKNIATFWGTGVPLQQWTPICLKLIAAYNVDPPMSARIMHCLNAALNDAFVITWHFKYLYDCARPCQLNRNLKTFLATPQFPSYISGHSVISATAQTVLSYFFPGEAEKLEILAKTASISRLFGGIHFKSDLEEGLKLGKQIGDICVSYMKRELDDNYKPIDVPFTVFKDAPIMPNYNN